MTFTHQQITEKFGDLLDESRHDTCSRNEVLEFLNNLVVDETKMNDYTLRLMVLSYRFGYEDGSNETI